jgi:hypothetical protein
MKLSLTLAAAMLAAIDSETTHERRVETLARQIGDLLTAKSLADEHLIAEAQRLGEVSQRLAERLRSLTRAGDEAVIPVVQALADVEVAARLASVTLTGPELLSMPQERLEAISVLRGALAHVDLARRTHATEREVRT